MALKLSSNPFLLNSFRNGARSELSFGGYDFWFYPCLAISPDAQKLAIYNGFDIELWDLSSGRFLDSFFLADEIDRHYDLEKPLLRISFISNKKLIFELILGDSYLFYAWKYMYAYNRRCLNYLGISRFPESCPILSFCHDRSLFLVMNYNLQIISLTKIKSNTPLEIDNNIPNYYLMLRGTQSMNLLLLAKQGNHGGIAPT